MNAETAKIDEGWGWPLNSPKAHYFRGSRSLCGRWAFFGPLEQQSLLGLRHSARDCKTCTKRLVAPAPASEEPKR